MNIKDKKDGFTALHLVVQNDCKETVEFLCQHGADVHAQDNSGYTALHKAVKTSCIESIPVLLQYAANPNFRSDRGQSIFQDAVFFDNNTNIFLYSSRFPNFYQYVTNFRLRSLISFDSLIKSIYEFKKEKYEEIVKFLLPYISYDTIYTTYDGDKSCDRTNGYGRTEGIAALIKDAMEILEQARKINKKNALKKSPFYFHFFFKEDNNMTVQMARDIIRQESSLIPVTVNKIKLSDISELP